MEAQYDQQANVLLNEAKENFGSTGWIDYKKGDGITMEYKYFPDVCDLARYRIQATIKKPLNTVVGFVWDATQESMQKDDPSVKVMEVLETGNNCKVRRIVHGMSWPIWDRETVFAQMKHQNGNDVWLIGFSVDHDSAPLKPKEYVRTKVHMSVYKYSPIDENTTLIQRVAQVDPCGAIPHWAVEQKAGKAMETFKSWAE